MIAVRNLSKRYGDFAALDDVTVDVPEGSLTALLGPSGSGKSTLLRTIAGLELPDAGTVVLDGADVTAVPPQRRGIGFVFQHYAAFKHMTVRDNVAFGLTIRRRPRAADQHPQPAGVRRHHRRLAGAQRQREAREGHRADARRAVLAGLGLRAERRLAVIDAHLSPSPETFVSRPPRTCMRCLLDPAH